MEDSRLPEAGIIEGPRRSLEQLGIEEFDPLAIGSLGHLAGISAVAGEESFSLSQVEVNGPLIALHVVRNALVGFQVIAGEKEILALGKLPVIPDGFSVQAPKLVASNLHSHGALVDEPVMRAIGMDHPDAIDLMPRAFMALH